MTKPMTFREMADALLEAEWTGLCACGCGDRHGPALDTGQDTTMEEGDGATSPSSPVEVPVGAEIYTFASWDEAKAYFQKPADKGEAPQGASPACPDHGLLGGPDGSGCRHCADLNTRMNQAIAEAGAPPSLTQPDPHDWLLMKAAEVRCLDCGHPGGCPSGPDGEVEHELPPPSDADDTAWEEAVREEGWQDGWADGQDGRTLPSDYTPSTHEGRVWFEGWQQGMDRFRAQHGKGE